MNNCASGSVGLYLRSTVVHNALTPTNCFLGFMFTIFTILKKFKVPWQTKMVNRVNLLPAKQHLTQMTAVSVYRLTKLL